MNATFLLVTTAWIAGADAAAPTAPLPATPVYSVGMGGCASGGCASGGCGSGGCATCGDCGSESGGLFSKLKGRFHHGGGDCGCEAPKCGGHSHQSDCGCASCGSTCDTCGSGHGGGGGGLFSRLKGRFHHGSECGCDTGCASCDGCGSGGCGGVLSPMPLGGMPKAEPIGPPKGTDERQKLPPGDKGAEKKPGSVQLIPQPISVPSLQITPTGGKSPF